MKKTWSRVLATVLVLAMVLCMPGFAASVADTTDFESDRATSADELTDADLPELLSASGNHYPIVLVHGLSGAAATNWTALSPQLAKAGYCVFALTYGRPPGLPPITGGFAPMERSAPELADFVDRVLDATGARQVDL